LVNKPFNLRKEYMAWLLSENLPLTPSGKAKEASASKLAGWVLATCMDITEKTEEVILKMLNYKGT
jgi:hypothetical protein